MRIGGLILCRMDSSRLPGKVLMPINNISILNHVINKASRAEKLNGGLVITTTKRNSDNDIVNAVSNEKNVSVFRGDTNNVAKRILECSKEYKLDYFLRINADSPFIDHKLINEACLIANSNNYDFITNLYPRSFPYGVSIELIKTEFYEKIYSQITSDQDREHVTRYLYNNMKEYSFYNIKRNGENLSELSLVVDDFEDYKKLKMIADNYDGDLTELDYDEAIKIKNNMELTQ